MAITGAIRLGYSAINSDVNSAGGVREWRVLAGSQAQTFIDTAGQRSAGISILMDVSSERGSGCCLK